MLFKNQPIRRKLAIVTLGATILALTLACAGFAIYERESFRRTTSVNLQRWPIRWARMQRRL